MAELPNFYKSSFGDLALWISRLHTSRGRTQIVHEMSTGGNYVVQDKGPRILQATATVMFDFMRDDDLAPLDRVRKLLAAVDDKARIFRHPVEGSFLARVGPFGYDVESSGVITAEVEFTAVEESTAVASAAAGSIPATGDGAVAAAAEAMTAELADIGETSTLPAEAAAAADSWAASDDLNPREVIAQTGSLTEKLGDQAAIYEDDVDAWSAFRATLLLAAAVRDAGEAATSDVAQTFLLKIGSSVALRALLANVFGAEDVDALYDRTLLLNDITNPAWLDSGTELVLPSPAPRARSA